MHEVNYKRMFFMCVGFCLGFGITRYLIGLRNTKEFEIILDTNEMQGQNLKRAINLINSASSEVYINLSNYQSAKITKAIIARAKEGVNFRILLCGKKTEEIDMTAILDLANQTKDMPNVTISISTEVNKNEKLVKQHMKIMVIDKNIVFGGSFNFKENSDSDTGIVVQNRTFALQLINNWHMCAAGAVSIHEIKEGSGTFFSKLNNYIAANKNKETKEIK